VSLTAGTDDIAAEIAAHRAEIVRHDETIEHGDAHTPEPPAEEHKKWAIPTGRPARTTTVS
jgi:hypothetical protein